MDLEAPGVSGFLDRHGELLPAQATRSQDVLSLLSLALDATRRNAPVADLPPLSQFCRSVRPERLGSLKPKFGVTGRLDVIGVEHGDHYLERLANLGLKDLEQAQVAAVSSLLNQYCKAQQFGGRAPGLAADRTPGETPYDYVLIDSRTGFTEVGGLCVGPWADRLVVVTGLNDQNVTGTKEFLRVVGLGERDPESVAPWDEGDPVKRGRVEQQSLGPKPTLLVASPVPVGETEETRRRLEVLRRELRLAPLRLSYHPLLALLERVFVRDYPDESLTTGYRKLTDAVLRLAGDHPEQLVRAALDRRSRDFAAAIALAVRAAAGSEESARTLLPVMAGQVTATTPARDVDHLFGTWAEGASEQGTVDYLWGEALRRLGEAETGPAAIGLLSRAGERYAASAAVEPSAAATFLGWGLLLKSLALCHGAGEADALFDGAEKRFAEAAELRPEWAEAYFRWGETIVARGRYASAEVGARERFRRALAIDPSCAPAAFQLGVILGRTAESAPRTDRSKLLEEAGANFALAIEQKENVAQAHLRRGGCWWRWRMCRGNYRRRGFGGKRFFTSRRGCGSVHRRLYSRCRGRAEREPHCWPRHSSGRPLARRTLAAVPNALQRSANSSHASPRRTLLSHRPKPSLTPP